MAPDWINGTDRRPPLAVLLVISVAFVVAAIDLFVMLNGG